MSKLKLFIMAFLAQAIALLTLEFWMDSYGLGEWFKALSTLFD